MIAEDFLGERAWETQGVAQHPPQPLRGSSGECRGLKTAETFPSRKVTLLAMSATSAHQVQIRLGQLTKNFSAAETLTFQYSSETSQSTSGRQS